MAKAKQRAKAAGAESRTGRISVVPIAGKICKPFLLEVMVFSPEAGFKFKVIVERSCTPTADPIWKLVFDLFQVKDGAETQLVHVSYTTETPVESTAVERMATEGVKPPQARVIIQKVHPAAKTVAEVAEATQEQADTLTNAMSEAIRAG